MGKYLEERREENVKRGQEETTLDKGGEGEDKVGYEEKRVKGTCRKGRLKKKGRKEGVEFQGRATILESGGK